MAISLNLSKNDVLFYTWENKTPWCTVSYPKLTLGQCQFMVNGILRDFEFKKRVKVKDGRGASYARATGEDEIHLPHWSRRKPWIIHETAHILAPDEKEDHGPAYLNTYAMLVEKYLGHEALRVIFSARRHGLRFSTRDIILPWTK